MIGAARRSTLSATTLARSSTSPSSTSTSMSRTSLSSSIQSWRFTDPIWRLRPAPSSTWGRSSQVSTSAASSAVAATGARSRPLQQRRSAMPSALSGRTASRAVRAHGHGQVRPAGRRQRGAGRRSRPPRGAARPCSRRPTACPRPAPRAAAGGPSRASRPAYVAATGPPCAGRSRVKITGRSVGRSSPTTTTVRAAATASRARSSRVRPGTSTERLVGAVEAAAAGRRPARSRRTPPEAVSPTAARPTASGQTGGMQVTLVQEASGLDPAEQPRPAARADARRQRPRGASRRRSPATSGRPAPTSASTPSRSTARSPPSSPRSPPSATRPSSPACSRRGADPGPAVQHAGGARRGDRVVPQDPPLRLLRLPRVRPALTAGPLTPVIVDVAGLTLGLMTCYDLRFPELARALVDRGAEVLVVPAAWVAGPRKVEHWRTLVRARAIENTVVRGRGRPARAALHGPLDRGRPARRRARRGRGDAPGRSRATLDRDAVSEARRTNPSLANRRL